jgi:hypothetical protein
MIIDKYFIGYVKDNDDPDQNGKVKVDIPELYAGGIPEKDMKWATPKSSFSSFIPEVDEIVYCYFLDFNHRRNLYYCDEMEFNENNKHTIFKDDIKSKIDGWNSSYPDNKFIVLKNKICIAMSSNDDNPELALYSPKGTYVFIDKDGNMVLQSSKNTDVKTSTGTITVEVGAAGTVDVKGGTIKMNSTANSVSPDGANFGPFCAIPNCLFTSAPHQGNTAT